ncbi:MAG: hypothetical protein IIY77_08985 [Lachnospiraceae bacterium]|nr:hypothetical protein [Lachnospiraceae bacterium]
MKANTILDVINDIDDEMIRHTGDLRERAGRSRSWIRWAAAAACLFLIAGAVWFLARPKGKGTIIIPSETGELLQALAVQIDSMPAEYYELGEQRHAEYGLPEKVSAEELGGVLGIVTGSLDTKLIGKKAYYYKNAPEKKNICIIDVSSGPDSDYRVYQAYGYTLYTPAGITMSEAFSVYGFPEKFRSIAVYDAVYDAEHILRCTITDREKQRILTELLLNGISTEGNILKQRAADLWKETFGNEQYRVNERGDLVLFPEGEGRFITETDSDGTESVQFRWPERDQLEKQVYDFFNEGAVSLEFENTEGFKCLIYIQPRTRTVTAFNGGFDFSEEKMSELVEFLQSLQ